MTLPRRSYCNLGHCSGLILPRGRLFLINRAAAVAAKPQGYSQHSAVASCRRTAQKQVVCDWIKDLHFPGEMPAAILKEGAERKPEHTAIGVRLAACGIEKCRCYFMHGAIVRGMFVFELSENSFNPRTRTG